MGMPCADVAVLSSCQQTQSSRQVRPYGIRKGAILLPSSLASQRLTHFRSAQTLRIEHSRITLIISYSSLLAKVKMVAHSIALLALIGSAIAAPGVAPGGWGGDDQGGEWGGQQGGQAGGDHGS